jgi:acetolactate synthase-1/3 small subunit
VDVSPESVMIEQAGTEDKLEAFNDLMKPYGIETLARTGVIAMPRGAQVSKDKASGDRGPVKRVRSLEAPAGVALPPS